MHWLQPHFSEIPKYCFNTSNGTESITDSILFRRLKIFVFIPSQDWQYFNSHKLEAHSKSQYSVCNIGSRGTANAQRFLLVGLVPLNASAVASVLWESCTVTRSPSCARFHRQTVTPLPPPTTHLCCLFFHVSVWLYGSWRQHSFKRRRHHDDATAIFCGDDARVRQISAPPTCPQVRSC